MGEHDDDLEPEVEEGAAIESESFPIPGDEDEEEAPRDSDDTDAAADDPDASEI